MTATLDMVEPAHLWVPERRGSYGDEAIDLAELAGRELDAEQRLSVDAILSFRAGGKWLALEAAMVEARQNGKTAGVLETVVLWDLWMLPPDRIVWTAHLFRTARDAFKDFLGYIETAPELSRRVKRINASHGEESIELHNGALLEFLARSMGGGRGLGGKRVVMDEALILSSTSMGALMPTLSARPDPQILYGSSAGHADSDHLRSLRDRGRRGNDPSLIWVEWCAPGSWKEPPCDQGADCPHVIGTEGCALDDEELWKRANHTLGRRITYDYVRAERRALPPLEFGRERLGWWEDPPDFADAAIGKEMWADRIDRGSKPLDPVAFAIDVPPDRSSATIAVGGRREDGLAHVGVVDSRRGVGWAIERIVELNKKWQPCAIVVDGRSAAASLIPVLTERGLTIEVTTSADMARACGAIYDAVVEGNLRHRGKPGLTAAVAAATTRPLGEGFAWDRRDPKRDISQWVAATLALHGFSVHGPTQNSTPSVAFIDL